MPGYVEPRSSIRYHIWLGLLSLVLGTGVGVFTNIDPNVPGCIGIFMLGAGIMLLLVGVYSIANAIQWRRRARRLLYDPSTNTLTIETVHRDRTVLSCASALAPSCPVTIQPIRLIPPPKSGINPWSGYGVIVTVDDRRMVLAAFCTLDECRRFVVSLPHWLAARVEEVETMLSGQLMDRRFTKRPREISLRDL